MSIPHPSLRADWLLHNGTIFTASEPAVAEAVAIGGDAILFAGSDAEARAWVGPDTETVNLRGRFVTPGFCDAHVHPLMGSDRLSGCDLSGAETLQACLARLREFAATHPDRPVLRGGGWVHGSFPPAGPSKEDLDGIVADRPIFLTSMDGHSAWTNSCLLELAGVTADSPDPAGGRIERLPGTREPSGTLREWSAMDLVKNGLPAPSRRERENELKAFMAQAARFGITSVHDAMARPEHLDAYAELDRRNELTLRIHAALLCEPGSRSLKEILPDLRARYAGPHVRLQTAKLFLDGVIEAHTAYLLEPYADRSDFRGSLLWDPPAFARVVAELCGMGLQIHVHAIGDGAARLALDALEAAGQAHPESRRLRHLLAHLDLMAPTEISRMAALGAIAILQPAWFYMDRSFFDSFIPCLGLKRANKLYRIRSLRDAGVRMACGSDWPYGGDNSNFNPLEAIAVGATRTGLGENLDTPFTPEQCLDVSMLLRHYTIDGAYANFMEQDSGSIAPGKKADLAVLDRNLLEIPLREIAGANVLLTFFEGKPVFRDPSW